MGLLKDKTIKKIRTELMENLTKTATLMDLNFEKFYKQFGLTRVQFYALYLIESMDEEGIPLSLLGEKMSVSRANITTLIDRMEKRGFVRREYDSRDRRSIKLSSTQKGKEILKEIIPDREKFITDIFSFLNEKELLRANEILEKIQEEFKKIFHGE